MLKTRNAKNKITNPTTEATIWPLAASTAALSPPDSIHLTAPHAKKNKAITTAITKIKVIAAPMIPGISVVVDLQSFLNGSCMLAQFII